MQVKWTKDCAFLALSIYEDMKKWVLTLLVNLSLVANRMH